MAHSNNSAKEKLTVDSYFGSVILVLTALIFIALVLGFLYLVYGKEDEGSEEEE